MRSAARDSELTVLPDNLEAFEVFVAATTQWRYLAGFSGIVPVGLDYARLESVLRLKRVARGRRREVFADVQVMESAALDVLRRRR